MRKRIIFACVIGMLVLVSGCGSDMRDELIRSTISFLNTAAGSMSNIRDNVKKWDEEKKDANKTNLVKNAVTSTESLAKVARDFQRIKQESVRLAAAPREERDELAQKYRDQLAAAVQKVKKEQDSLNQALVKAEADHPDQKDKLSELRQKLQLVQGDFDILTRQQ